MTKLVIIMCPPLADCPEPPKDVALCRLVDCPHCEEKMWLSPQKKQWKDDMVKHKRDFYLGCHKCLLKLAKKGFLKESKIIKIEL